MRVDTREYRDRGAEGRDLRQREVDKDHAALYDVHAEVRMDARQDHARQKRQY